ncbi:hypothetical protein THAOC_18780 [Thalassiosira oceanica]|uniref:Uncharacterized protein n=1 Tax=Thalassiosira oceanica TaxID=159749 RepID=K0SR57_THAOC|nr:hypothetical protein THAOC_18780 [Thalassiosira oceanica]|mmetsp:Transcript_29168/g.69439  ORF Transcript_29168/g.69439 Transcript_29168/m.69439 type:complete len:158 (+) Transcript_29168:62-535(+)|eukprot:EJK60807.1 hypothetical protein THAOC_18780 [Thalassiosira oceanica]
MPGFGGFSGAQSTTVSSKEIDASTPWVAASDGDLDLLKASIEKLGLEPGATDDNGFTCLHAACGYCRVDVIRWLLAAKDKVDVNCRDSEGDTPLHHCDDATSAKMLIEAGADCQLKNDDGKTPLKAKEEELSEMEEDDEDEDYTKLKELVVYLTGLR